MVGIIQVADAIITWMLAVPVWQAILGILGASLLAGKTLELLITHLAPQFTNKTDSTIDNILVKRLPKGLYATVLVVGGYLSVTVLNLPLWAQTPSLGVIVTLFVTAWTVVTIQVGRDVAELGQDKTHVDEGLIPIFKNIWTFLIAGVGVFAVMDIWGIDITPFLASAGIVGIAVGFAAKDTVANFFGSIALYMDGTYSVGDYIVLDSGEHGWVENISIRSTQIRTRDDLIVTVPNSMLNSGKVVNESTPTPKRRIRVPVGVDYDSDVEEVMEVLADVAADEEMVVQTPQPQAVFREFGDSALEFELLVWIPNPATRPRVTHKLNRGIHQRFAENGITIPYPQRVVSGRSTGDEDSE